MPERAERDDDVDGDGQVAEDGDHGQEQPDDDHGQVAGQTEREPPGEHLHLLRRVEPDEPLADGDRHSTDRSTEHSSRLIP